MHLWPVANWYLLLFLIIEYMNLTAKYFPIILDLETLMFTNTRSQVDSTLIFSSRFDKILYTSARYLLRELCCVHKVYVIPLQISEFSLRICTERIVKN